MNEREYFQDIDLPQFWNDGQYQLDTYVEPPPDEALIKSIEDELGYKLPQSYIWLMQEHNGGAPVNNCFPTATATSWAEDHIAITNIKAIGREKTWDLCGSLGSKHLIGEWGYPAIGVYIANCPSAGHDAICLDYSECGPSGEPKVVHVDQELGYAVTILAKDFETFIQGLRSEESL